MPGYDVTQVSKDKYTILIQMIPVSQVGQLKYLSVFGPIPGDQLPDGSIFKDSGPHDDKPHQEKYFEYIRSMLVPLPELMANRPEFKVTGTVTDAETGKPIAGVQVYDDGYNNNKHRTTTDENGSFTLYTANEEHNISAKADGYETQTKLLKTRPFANNKNFNFELMPVDVKPVVRWLMAAVKDGLIKEIQQKGQYIKTESKGYHCYKLSPSQTIEFLGKLTSDSNQNVIFKTKGLWLLEPTGSHRRASAHTDSDNLKNDPFVGYAAGGAGPYKFAYKKNKYQLDIEHEAVNCFLNSGSTLNGSVFYKGDLTAGDALVFVGKMPVANDVQPYHTKH
jgi:hypothetical protein